MPRTKEQNEEIRRQRMEEILKAALKVYVDKGYAAAEIGDVAKEAGLARGLVYYYYKDKQTLFRELFQFMFERSRRHVHMHLSSDKPALASLESYIQSLFRSVFEHPENMLFFMRMRHDLNLLFSEEELKSIRWTDESMEQLIKKMESGMEKSEIRSMSPKLLAMQFWGGVMLAMRYLQEKRDAMVAEGKDIRELDASLSREIEEAIDVCLSMLRPH